MRCVGYNNGREAEGIQIRVPALFRPPAHIYCQTTFSLPAPRQETLLQFADTKPSTQDPSLSLHLTGLPHLPLNKNTDKTGIRWQLSLLWEGIL